ncbi:MAG: hypothetical protein V8R01_00335 [Bacilli bacterium]
MVSLMVIDLLLKKGTWFVITRRVAAETFENEVHKIISNLEGGMLGKIAQSDTFSNYRGEQVILS